MRKLVFAGVVVTAAMGVWGGEPSSWDLTKTTGFYDAAENWSNGVPFGGFISKDVAIYGVIPRAAQDALHLNNNTITIRFPETGYTDSSATLIHGVPSGYSRDVIFDARGTWWEKHGTNIEFAVIKNGSTDLGSGHVFRMELHNLSAVLPLFRLTDGIVRIHSNGSGSEEVHLDAGTWDFLTPGGVTLTKPTNIYLGYSKGMHMYLHRNASFFGNIHIHSRLENNRLFVDGGNHRIKNLEVANSSSWGHYEARAEIYNDAQVSSDGVYLGVANNNPPCVGRLCVSNTAALTVHSGFFFGYDNRIGVTGILEMHDQALIDAKCGVVLGAGTHSTTGIVSMANYSRFQVAGRLDLAQASNACATVTLKDDTRLDVLDSIYVSSKHNDAHSSVTLSENAVFTVKPHAMLSTKEGGVSRFDLSGNSKFEVDRILQLGQETSGTAELNLSENAAVTVGEAIQVRTRASNPALISLAGNATLRVPAFTHSGVWNLSADGGTIEIPAFVADATIPATASAVLGAQGLTIAAHSDVTVHPAFSGEGTLTLTGLGKVTLTGASTHAGTVVSPNTQIELGGGASLGGTLTLQTNAVLRVPAHVSASVAQIRVDGMASIWMNANGSIEIAEVVGDEAIRIVVDDASAEAGQTYPIIRFPEGQAADPAKFHIVNRTTGREYSLAANGSTINLTMREGATRRTLTYVGTDGVWGAASNWSDGNGGEGVPTINDDAVIPASAAGGEIAIQSESSVASLTIENDVTLTGEKMLHIGQSSGLRVLSGKAHLAVPLGVCTPFVVNTVAGSTTTVSRAFLSYDSSQVVRFEKTGSGALVVSGDNRAFDVDWILLHGKTTFVGQNAFGMNTDSLNGLVLSNNTVRYEGDAATIRRPVKIAGGYPAVFETVGDLTFESFVINPGTTNCCFTKIGRGRLTFELPVGTTTLTKFFNSGEKRGVGNALSAWGSFELPENGEITNWNGVGQLNIFEGALHIKGQGLAASEAVNSGNTLVGGSQYDAQTAPELVFENVKAQTGSSGHVMTVARNMRAGSAQPRITVLNSKWTEDSLFFGYHREVNAVVEPILAITNSTVTFGFELAVAQTTGNDLKKIKPHILMGDRSTINTKHITLGGALHLDVSENSAIKLTNYCFYAPVNGLSIRYGGEAWITAPNYTLYAYDTAADPLEVEYDGATLQVTATANTACRRPDVDGFRVAPGGMKLETVGEITHTFAMPIRGAGRVAKTGVGTCVFPQAYTLTDKNAATPSTGEVLLNEGGLNVAEGVAVIHAGAAADTYDVVVENGAGLEIDGDVTLGSVGGAGTISGGALSAAILAGANAAAPTFTNITLADMRVDLQIPAGEECPKPGTAYTVAHLGADVTANVGAWKSVNVGEGGRLDFSLVNGSVVAQVKSTRGMVLILR